MFGASIMSKPKCTHCGKVHCTCFLLYRRKVAVSKPKKALKPLKGQKNLDFGKK
jgi:hypothetical protein